MIDNEIIKAWECCKKDKFEPHCSKCPLEERSDCQIVLESEMLPLLNRQKAEIEALNKENKRLKDKYEIVFQPKAMIKAEAVKEFAERLKEKKQWDVDIPDYVYVEDIDNLVKEMVGEG